MRITRWGEYGILCCLYLALDERKFLGDVPPSTGSAENQSSAGITSAASLRKESAGSGNTTSTAVGAAEIAENQGIPTQYAQQILHRLRKGGVIKSVRGPKGGFLLARPANEISLHQILLSAEGQTFELICENDPVHEQACVHADSCGLRNIWEELQGTINSFLSSRSLASVLEIHPSIIRSNLRLVDGPHRKVQQAKAPESPRLPSGQK